jgi:TonB family protein
MSTPTVLWKKWEGRVVDEKFPLLQSLGSSDHSAVFLTERPGSPSQKLAIKLFPATGPTDGLKDDAQLTRWQSAAKLSHPHLLRLFECGLCQLDGTELLYVVMEYAEENLEEILPLRALAPAEASEMLPPVLDVLSFLHRSGFAHDRIRPANIMAVDEQLKLSADSLGKIGDSNSARASSAYDAPELATTGSSPAADVWSLGVTLITVLTQSQPHSNSLDRFTIPETIPQPLHEIIRHCLQANPSQRCTVDEIRKQLQPEAIRDVIQTHARIQANPVEANPLEPNAFETALETKSVQPPAPQAKSSRWLLVSIVIAAILLVAWIGIEKFGSRLMPHSSQLPAEQTTPQTPATPATQTPAPFSQNSAPAQKKVAGTVLNHVLPEVSRSAQNTITGTLKIIVQVSVDASGNVAQAKLVSAGPSKYFANLTLAAARRWKFTPPRLDGQPTTSEWILRFQFKRTSVQAFPAEVSPEEDKIQKVRRRR